MTRLEELKNCGAVVMAAGPWGFTLTWLADTSPEGAQIEAAGQDFDAVVDTLYRNVMAYRKDTAA
jgi:hypothetical protein